MAGSKLKHIGIQFFAEAPTDADTGAEGNPQENTPPTTPPPPAGKTYTQEDLNRLLAAEKRQGKHSILSELGLDPADKDAVKKVKEVLDAQKSQKEKDDEALRREKKGRAAAEAKATAAERKLTALTSGCKAEFIEEVMALAAVRVNEDTDFEAALAAVKEKCPTFFGEGVEEDDKDTGTGRGQGHARQQKNEKAGSLGERLAKKTVGTKTENPYFNN